MDYRAYHDFVPMHCVVDDVVPVNELTLPGIVRAGPAQVWELFEQIDLGEDRIGEPLSGLGRFLGLIASGWQS